jgi:sugar phosphate isomerase/epimerase
LLGEEQIRSAKAILLESKVQISNINAFTLYAIIDTYHPSWIENNDAMRELRIQHTVNCIELASKIGSKNISTEAGGPIDRANLDKSELKKFFANGLTRAAAVAEKEKVKILIEPEPNLLLENSGQFLEFIKSIRSDYVGLNFDIGHFYCVGEDPAEVVYELAGYIEHFHLADIANDRVHNHLIPGQGSIDFRSVFRAIREIGYEGFVTVELYPYQDNPIYAAKLAYQYLSGILSQVG